MRFVAADILRQWTALTNMFVKLFEERGEGGEGGGGGEGSGNVRLPVPGSIWNRKFAWIFLNSVKEESKMFLLLLDVGF